MKLEVIAGAQFGSEGKGHVTAQRVAKLKQDGHVVINVRVAGPNAGHCVIHPETGTKYAFRALPVGAVEPGVICYIAAGSEVDLDVLESEIDLLAQEGHLPAVFIDPAATLLTPEHIRMEQDSDLNAKAGSTAKGIGAARSERLWRRATTVRQDEDAKIRLRLMGVDIMSLDSYLGTYHGKLQNVAMVIEGTQGYGLGLHTENYPQVTSSDCRAIDFMAMAGISPWDHRVSSLQIWLATRVYPIRVAGNSGPLKGETTWDELGLEAEHTTVTKKVRRVGAWDGELVRKAVLANGGGRLIDTTVLLAITMLDQKFPWVEGETEPEMVTSDPEVLQWLTQTERDMGAQIGMVTTSENTAALFLTK